MFTIKMRLPVYLSYWSIYIINYTLCLLGVNVVHAFINVRRFYRIVVKYWIWKNLILQGSFYNCSYLSTIPELLGKINFE